MYETKQSFTRRFQFKGRIKNFIKAFTSIDKISIYMVKRIKLRAFN